MNLAYCCEPDDLATELFCRNLFNCYVREVGREAAAIFHGLPPFALPANLTRAVLVIKLPSLGVHLVTAVAGGFSATGTVETQGDPFVRDADGTWTRLGGETLVEIIADELTQHYAA